MARTRSTAITAPTTAPVLELELEELVTAWVQGNDLQTEQGNSREDGLIEHRQPTELRQLYEKSMKKVISL